MNARVRTTLHPFVGRRFRARDTGEGTCVSVTLWGNDRVRWVRLRHDDGIERSYSQVQLRRVE